MGIIIDRVRNRAWCAENAREIAEIDARAAARRAAQERLAAAILDEKRDTFARISADLAGFFGTDTHLQDLCWPDLPAAGGSEGAI